MRKNLLLITLANSLKICGYDKIYYFLYCYLKNSSTNITIKIMVFTKLSINYRLEIHK